MTTRILRQTAVTCSLLLTVAASCAHAQPSGAIARAELAPTGREPALQPHVAKVEGKTPAAPSVEDRSEQLRRLVQAELAHPDLTGSRISVVIAPLEGNEPLVAIEPDAKRLPASNAKLLTTTSAALVLPGKYRFATEVSRAASGGPLYLWGSGDPVLKRADLVRLAQAVRASGVRSARGIVVDDSHFGRERLAPGFESFAEGSYYRPTSGAVNVDGNAIDIQVSAPADRKRPRVDVNPPSDYVVVRKLVRYSPARRGPEVTRAKIKVTMEPRGSILFLTISGTMGRRAKTWSTRRAVYDPSLNAGWALRRALTQAGVQVSGTVRRGKRPAAATVIARREHSLADVLTATNTHSDNLAAETLVRAMSFVGTDAETDVARPRAARGSWAGGLRHVRQALEGLGLTEFNLANGSGLSRRTAVTARLMVALLQKIHREPGLSRILIPTLAVAGKSGTLGGRLRGTSAEGYVQGKTGTLGGALALSGFADVSGPHPVVFSILFNGRSDNVARSHIDRLAQLIASYARGLPLVEETPATQPAVEPTADPTAEPEPEPEPETQPASPPATQPAPTSPASQPAEGDMPEESPSNESQSEGAV